MSIPPELWAEISRLLDEAMNLERGEREAWLLRLDAHLRWRCDHDVTS